MSPRLAGLSDIPQSDAPGTTFVLYSMDSHPASCLSHSYNSWSLTLPPQYHNLKPHFLHRKRTQHPMMKTCSDQQSELPMLCPTCVLTHSQFTDLLWTTSGSTPLNYSYGLSPWKQMKFLLEFVLRQISPIT